MTFVEAEIASQPNCWRQAVEVARDLSGALGESGERIALLGCGTSWFVGQVAASARPTPSPRPRCRPGGATTGSSP